MAGLTHRHMSIKRILSAGRGPLPEFRSGTKATFDYEVLCPRGDWDVSRFPKSRNAYESIDNTRKSYPDGYGKPLEIVFGKEFQLPIFERCLQTMLVGEVSQFDIDKSELHSYIHISKYLRDLSKNEKEGECNKHAHHCGAAFSVDTGYESLNDLLKHPKPLRIIFHLRGVLQPGSYEQDSWQLNPEEKLASIAELRQKGNDFFKKDDFENASIDYKKALERINALLLLEKPGDPEWREIDFLNVPIYLNLSQCFIRMKSYYEAIKAATEVLKRDESNEKALFRRAKANIAVWNLKEAEADLQSLLTVNPKLKNLVNSQMTIIDRLIGEKTLCDKSVYKNMF